MKNEAPNKVYNFQTFSKKEMNVNMLARNKFKELLPSMQFILKKLETKNKILANK